MTARISNDLAPQSGEIVAKPMSPIMGRGNKIPNGDGYVLYVGTEPVSGRVWLVYSDDIEECPNLFEDYCAEFDQKFSK